MAAARDITSMFGGKKEMASQEQVTADFAFASVVTIKAVSEGERFTEENIWVKRPGTGEIHAREYESILGKRAACAIETDTQLKRIMIAE